MAMIDDPYYRSSRLQIFFKISVLKLVALDLQLY